MCAASDALLLGQRVRNHVVAAMCAAFSSDKPFMSRQARSGRSSWCSPVVGEVSFRFRRIARAGTTGCLTSADCEGTMRALRIEELCINDRQRTQRNAPHCFHAASARRRIAGNPARTARVRAGEIASKSRRISTGPDRESAPGFFVFDVNATRTTALA